MREATPSETSVSYYISRRHLNTEEFNMKFHRRESSTSFEYVPTLFSKVTDVFKVLTLSGGSMVLRNFSIILQQWHNPEDRGLKLPSP
jgi:hypothetical protein